MAGEWQEIPSGWRMVKLRELGEVNRGKSKHRPRYADHLYGGPYPFIQTGDIKASNGRITSYTQTYSEAGLAQSQLWPAGTMCITIAANIAETGILEFPACFPDSVVGFIADKNKADIYFIEYVFRFLRQRLQREASGSVQDNINLATLDRLRFPIPPLETQRAIAHILGTLDDKIELNRRTNQTLEAIAKALFKSWFVDFDPVRAKLEGRQPEGMDAETAALFPDGFGEDGLPRGWVNSSHLDMVEAFGGGTPKTTNSEYWNGTIPWFSVVDAPAETDVWVLDTEKKITQKGLEESATRLLPVGTTIISARGTVGRLALVGVGMAMNQSCYGLYPKPPFGPFFAYFVARNLVETLQQQAHGSVFDTITRATLQSASVVIPNPQVVARFEQIVKPLMDGIRSCLEESRTLAALRDSLLPKLLSGELNVGKTE
ncbi:MAG: restriction endonuclease subunit S [Thermaceae bacterium]|nr:restriction endonuclease subunit S [Thermaceae bacterium]